MAERIVLQVLPHPGGGGETYVDLLAEMPGYRFDCAYLAPSPTPSPALARGLARVALSVGRHDLLHVHGEAAAALCLPLLAARPSVVTLHGLHLARRLSRPARSAALLTLRAVLRAADRTICVAESERAALDALVGAAARRAVVVRNGVRLPAPGDPTERAAVREELGLSDSEPLAIWVGSLDERKDPLAALDATAQARVTLLVAGDGPLRPQVEQAARVGTARVLGRRRDVPRLLAAADLFLHTSRREGLSLSLLEAMAHGLAPLVRELPENVEAVGDSGTAYRDRDGLVDALRRLAADAVEREELGRRARRRVEEHFTAERMVAETRARYDDVLRERFT